MIVKLVTLAILAKHAMSAKIRVELNFPSPSLEKKEAKSVTTLTYGRRQVRPNGQGGVPLYNHNNR